MDPVPVVQIWIVHIKCRENSVNVQKCPNEPWIIPNFNTTLLLIPVASKKYARQEEATNVVSSTKVTHVPYRNHEASSEKLWFVRTLYKNLSQIGKKITTACWCHFMTPCQVSWISDKFLIYRNLETKFLNVSGRSTTPRCLKFIPISCMGPKHAPKDTYMIFQPILVH